MRPDVVLVRGACVCSRVFVPAAVTPCHCRVGCALLVYRGAFLEAIGLRAYVFGARGQPAPDALIIIPPYMRCWSGLCRRLFDIAAPNIYPGRTVEGIRTRFAK